MNTGPLGTVPVPPVSWFLRTRGIAIFKNRIFHFEFWERDGVSNEMAWDVNIKVFIKCTERVGFILLGPLELIQVP